MTDIVRLVFNNADATPKKTALRVDLAAVPEIMAWYFVYHAGDRYKVAIDGRNVRMDHNGEPSDWPPTHRIEQLEAQLAAADALADAFDSAGNVTDRHARALHALLAYREARK